MKISPMDIQRQTFGQRFRGLDPDEVRAYLNIVAEEVASLQMERDRLDQELGSLRSLIDEHRNRETILKNTLLTAQRVSEEIRDNARKEAETTVKEAEMQADRLVELAQGRAHEVERGILDLRAHRSALRTDVRALITRLSHLLDLQEEAELEDNLRFLKRREEAQVVEVRDVAGGATLRVRVSPRASRDEVAGERDGALVVRLTAPPVEGQANAALVRFLARQLGIPASAMSITRGGKGRDKVLLVTGARAADLRASLIG